MCQMPSAAESHILRQSHFFHGGDGTQKSAQLVSPESYCTFYCVFVPTFLTRERSCRAAELWLIYSDTTMIRDVAVQSANGALDDIVIAGSATGLGRELGDIGSEELIFPGT
jgi:hypothetical protein